MITRSSLASQVKSKPLRGPAFMAKAASRKSRRRRIQYRRNVLYALAAVGLFVTTTAGSILFFTLMPATWRIAVVSASEDARIVETIARVFARERSSVRLSLTVVEQGQAEALLNGGGADLATIRSDMLSGDLFAIAILRKCALFVWTTHTPCQKTARTTEWKNLAESRIAFLNGNPPDASLG